MAKFDTFVESFDSNTLEASRWSGAYGTYSVTNQRLEMTCTSGGANYQETPTLDSFDLTDSYVISELKNAGNQSLVSLEVYPLSLALDANNQVFFLVTGNTVSAYNKIATVSTLLKSTPYISTIHKWFRIREQGGFVYWDYSSDRITWINLFSKRVSSLFAVTALKLSLIAGVYASEASSTVAIFDNVNTGGTPAKLNPLVFRVSPRFVYTGIRNTPKFQGNAFAQLAKNSNNGFQEDNYGALYNLGFFGEDEATFTPFTVLHSQPVQPANEVVPY